MSKSFHHSFTSLHSNKSHRMESRHITCGYCHRHFLVTPNANKIRCQFCQALISVQAYDSVVDGASCWCLRTELLTKGTKPHNPMTSATLGHQPKRAVLCGVTYKDRIKHKLEGTVNDVKMMKSLLLDRCGFPEKAICVLTEGQMDPELNPTKENIEKALKWLVKESQPGDSLVFYFSGHGLRQPDFNDDELDGYDETICPSDFMTAGMILDNEINDIIVNPLQKGVTLHAIIDACHSGTILDLEHIYNPNNPQEPKWVDNKPKSGACKGTSGGLAVSLSACTDYQLAADTSAFARKEMTGAMTYTFVETIKENYPTTYGELLLEMHKKIEAANRSGCLFTSFLRKVFRQQITQEFQLSSSKEFDVNTKEFKL